MKRIETGNVVHGVPFGQRKPYEPPATIEAPNERQLRMQIWKAKMGALDRLNTALEELKGQNKTD